MEMEKESEKEGTLHEQILVSSQVERHHLRLMIVKILSGDYLLMALCF